MNEWQVGAALWLTEWLDSLASADAVGDLLSSDSQAAEFVALLQTISEIYPNAARGIAPAASMLIDELQTQLNHALALRRTLASQFDWSYALLLPVIIGESRDLSWRELVFNAVRYQREVTVLVDLQFGILERVLKDFRAELSTFDSSAVKTAFELSNKLTQHLHHAYRDATTSPTYKQHQAAALAAFTEVRECWRRIIEGELDSTVADLEVNTPSTKAKTRKDPISKKLPRKRSATVKTKKFP